MQFLSFSFLALFTLCFFLYYAVKGRARNLILLVTSCIFIGWYYLPFLLSSGSTVHLLLGTMDGKQGKSRKKDQTRLYRRNHRPDRRMAPSSWHGHR